MPIRPSYITGANAKLKAGGKIIAYAADVSYSVSVDHFPVEVLGRYEVVSNEPLNYFVGGQLSVVRYTKEAKQLANSGVINGSNDEGGNSADKWSGNELNPAGMLSSLTFDLEIYQKIDDDTDQGVLTITDCRLSRKGGGLNKRGVLIETYSFNGILVKDAGAGTGRTPSVGTDLS